MEHKTNLQKQIDALSIDEKNRLIEVQQHFLRRILVTPEQLTFMDIAALKESFGCNIILPIEQSVSNNKEVLHMMIKDYNLESRLSS